MQKILGLLDKYRFIIAYLFFGAMTTAVNLAVYLPCYNLLGISAAVSNVISWVAAVIFSFLTNKPFVFKSHDWSAKTVVPEFSKFVGSRIASGALETGLIFLTVDCLLWNGNVMKIIISVLGVIMNYITSKLLVFRK